MKLVAIAGRKGSGKDTLADGLRQPMEFAVNGPVVKGAFAATIKNIALEHLRLPWNVVFSSKYRDEVVWMGMTARQLLQQLGQKLREVHPDFHIHCLEQWLQDHHAIISDLRYPNEAAWVKSVGGFLVRLHRNPQPGDTHESETSLDAIPPDRVDVEVPVGLDAQQTLDLVWPKVKEYLCR